MEISQEAKDKISKLGETIYSKGFTDGKAKGKNQTQNEKDLVRVAEQIAKQVDENKNIPNEKKMRDTLTKAIGEPTRDNLLRVGSEALKLAQTMPKPEKKQKASPPTPQTT